MRLQRFRCECKHPFTCLGSISITTNIRIHLPSPGEDRLVLFTVATRINRNASGHNTHWICQGYRICSINRPESLLNFWTLSVGVYWIFTIFSNCSNVCFATKQHQSKVSVNYSEENSVFREVSKSILWCCLLDVRHRKAGKLVRCPRSKYSLLDGC